MQLDSHLIGVSSSPEMDQLYKALNAAQQQFNPIKKSGLNKVEGYRYATLRDICDATLPGLLKNGLTMPTFSVGYDSQLGMWVMVGTLAHVSGQWTSSVCPLLLGFGPEDRPGIQAMEVACTYAKKILMSGLCGGWLEAEEGESEVPPAAEITAVAIPETVTAPALPAPVKQQKKKSKAQATALTEEAKDLLRRAEKKLAEKAGDESYAEKVWASLDNLVQMGTIPSSEVVLLRAKYKVGATEASFSDPFPAAEQEVTDAE